MKKSTTLMVIVISTLLTTLSIAHGSDAFTGTYTVSDCEENGEPLTRTILLVRGDAAQQTIEAGQTIQIDRRGSSLSFITDPDNAKARKAEYQTTELTRLSDSMSYEAELTDRRLTAKSIRHNTFRDDHEIMIIRRLRFAILGDLVLIRKSYYSKAGVLNASFPYSVVTCTLAANLFPGKVN